MDNCTISQEELMKKSIRWLRISFWVGIIVDGIVTIVWINPEMVGILGSDSGMGIDTRIALGWAASLLLAWTLLLFWGVMKPMERKGILLLTCFPLISGLCVTNLFGYINDIISPASFIAVSVLLISLMALMLSSYLYAGRIQRKQTPEIFLNSNETMSANVTKNITQRLSDYNRG